MDPTDDCATFLISFLRYHGSKSFIEGGVTSAHSSSSEEHQWCK